MNQHHHIHANVQKTDDDSALKAMKVNYKPENSGTLNSFNNESSKLKS